MIVFSVDVIGLERIQFGLDRIAEGLSDFRPFFEDAEEEFHTQERDWFAAAPFEPLSPEYAKTKALRFPGKPILRATDLLYKSLTETGAEGGVSRIDDTEAEFGTSVIYARRHQRGDEFLPSRPPLAEPDTDRYRTLAGNYVEDLLRKAGFN